MRKAFIKTNHDLPEDMCIIGFLQDYIWKSAANGVGPKKSGRYLTIDKYGMIRIMRCTGESDFHDKSLFETAMDRETSVWLDGNTATDHKLLDLYINPQGLWFTVESINGYEYDEYSKELCIYSLESDEYPAYFLELNLNEIPENFKSGTFVADEDPEYFELGDRGEYIKIKKEEC